MLTQTGTAGADSSGNGYAQLALKARTLRSEISAADDAKISKIISYVNRIGDAEINRTLLDPFRTRLAALRPSRPLRLARLLFLPLDPLIVPPRNWRPNQSRIPRTALMPLTAVVQAGLGPHGPTINDAIDGKTTREVEIVTEVGGVLWPLAASILATATAPAGWTEAGLPVETFKPLALSLATVLSRAPQLRRLTMGGQTGLSEDDVGLIETIMADISGEPADGAAMVTQLILLEAPHAASVLRRHVSASRDANESIALNKAMARGLDESLTYLERDSEFAKRIEEKPIAEAADHVRLVAMFLSGLEGNDAAGQHRARIRTLRDRLNKASRICFDRRLKEGLQEPLGALRNAVTAADQRRLEANARELRTLETVARQFGDAAVFDRQLQQRPISSAQPSLPEI